jgi:hypothetical protein
VGTNLLNIEILAKPYQIIQIIHLADNVSFDKKWLHGVTKGMADCGKKAAFIPNCC